LFLTAFLITLEKAYCVKAVMGWIVFPQTYACRRKL